MLGVVECKLVLAVVLCGEVVMMQCAGCHCRRYVDCK